MVACVCINLACKWLKLIIPLSVQQKEWFTYIDNEISYDLLEKLTDEFLAVFNKNPTDVLQDSMNQACKMLSE